MSLGQTNQQLLMTGSEVKGPPSVSEQETGGRHRERGAAGRAGGAFQASAAGPGRQRAFGEPARCLGRRWCLS